VLEFSLFDKLVLTRNSLNKEGRTSMRLSLNKRIQEADNVSFQFSSTYFS